ncbi:MAG TPA: hypothetical protein DCS93_34710 [Microscillaceae bacterium]|nr:hypothetical protein [Microscillaceae bacterium]
MKKIVIEENEFTSIYYDQTLKLYEQYWHPATADMQDEDYQIIQSRMVAFVKKHRLPILNYYLDNREFYYVMSPEMQDWQVEFVGQKLFDITHAVMGDLSSIKVAVIISSEFISQLSIEQTFEENSEQVHEGETRYFDDDQKALEWLLV